MKIGYARTSTLEQRAGLDAQVRDLKAAGCEKLFREQVSSVAPRAKLESALDFVRKGDVLVVTKLDQLARSTADLLRIMELVKQQGATLKVMDMNLDTGTATGKLMFTVIGAIAEFERQMMLERQREGIAKAKAEGKYKGRQPTARMKSEQAKALKAQGMGATEIARRLNIGRASVYRVLAA
jgi:DNA invertase Pin-like site-specific DNA recombinase